METNILINHHQGAGTLTIKQEMVSGQSATEIKTVETKIRRDVRKYRYPDILRYFISRYSKATHQFFVIFTFFLI